MAAVKFGQNPTGKMCCFYRNLISPRYIQSSHKQIIMCHLQKYLLYRTIQRLNWIHTKKMAKYKYEIGYLLSKPDLTVNNIKKEPHTVNNIMKELHYLCKLCKFNVRNCRLVLFIDGFFLPDPSQYPQVRHFSKKIVCNMHKS